VLGVVASFLAGMDRGSEIGFPVVYEFLRTLDRVLGFVPELLAFPGEQLPRFLSGLWRIKHGDTGADNRADDKGGQTAPLWFSCFRHDVPPVVLMVNRFGVCRFRKTYVALRPWLFLRSSPRFLFVVNYGLVSS
jgi:hypothetical protein